jgi:predicted dienelactone hydrolase
MMDIRVSRFVPIWLRSYAVTQLRSPARRATEQPRNRATVFLTIAALLAVTCATPPRDRDEDGVKAPVARYSSEAGSTPVGVIPDASLHDTARGRDVSLSIDYPIAAGPHPLIVFSHGFGATGRQYVGLSSHWASNGYIVIKPTHAGDNNVRLADITPSSFDDRVADIKFVLDSLPALQQKYPELQGKIDTAKIGVAGHSLGALTAMLIGGLRVYPGPKSYADPRVKAVIAMSPQGPRESWGLTKESWSELRGPVMYMTGDRDKGIDDTETPEWRREAFELSAAGDKWLVFIQGAGHLAFTGRLGVMPEPPPVTATMADPNDPFATRQTLDAQRQRTGTLTDPLRATSGTIKAISLAFWDTYLRGDAAGREFLDKAGERSGVEVKRK